MTDPVAITFAPLDADTLAGAEGRLAILVEAEGKMNAMARKVDGLARKAVARLVASPGWAKAKTGEATLLSFPAGLAAEGLVVVKAPRKPTAAEARTIGVVGTRINYDMPGTRSLFTSAGRKARGGLEPPYRETILDMARSRSSFAMMDEAQRERHLAAVLAFYDDYGRGMDGMQIPYVTRCYRAVVVDRDGTGPSSDDQEPDGPVVSDGSDTDMLLIDFR